MIHTSKRLAAVIYTGEEDIKVRELKTIPLPTVKTGDVLIVELKTAKFLSREGKPFEMFDLDNATFFDEDTAVFLEQATSKIASLEDAKGELENQLSTLEDEKLEASQKADKFAAAYEELKTELTSSEEEKIKATKKADKFEEDNKVLEDENTNLKSENQKLNEALKSATTPSAADKPAPKPRKKTTAAGGNS